MSIHTLSESQLVVELKQGNPKAFTQLMTENKDLVYRTCLGFVHNADEAEDLAQEVFVQVYFSLKNFREDAKLSTWLYRIAVNKSLNHLRSVANARTELIDNNVLPQAGIDYHSPDRQMEQQQRHQALYAAIDSLPESQRVAFSLSKFEGLSYQEIADVMEQSVSAIESLLHRAKKSLQKKLIEVYKNMN